MKKFLYFLFAAIIFSGGCGYNPDSGKMKFSGHLELTEHALGAKVAGRLTTLNTDEGKTVLQGEQIATFDRYEQSKRDYARVENLFKQGGATAQDLEHALLAMEDQRIVSPIDGVVLVKVHEVGEIVSLGSPVIVIGDRKSLWVRIYVPEGQINKIKMGQSARLAFDGLKENFTGRVSFIASQAEFTPRNVQTAEERITQTFAVKITLDQAPEYLRPGVAVDVTIDILRKIDEYNRH